MYILVFLWKVYTQGNKASYPNVVEYYCHGQNSVHGSNSIISLHPFVNCSCCVTVVGEDMLC